MPKLNLGCGKDKQPKEEGWVNVDAVVEFEPDLVHDLRDPLPYDEGTIDYIKAKDILEHFNKYQVVEVFKDWVRVLKKGCIIEILVPDIEIITKDFSGKIMVDLIYGEPLFSGVNTEWYGNHKSGHSKESIKRLFWDCGLDVLEIKNVDGTNIYARGLKK